MLKTAIVLSCALLVAGIAVRDAFALAGNLKHPSIGVPQKDGKSDPVAQAMLKALTAREKQFAGGHFINAHSFLHFDGGTETINALLEDLSKIEGAVLRIKLAKGSAVAQGVFPGDEGPEKECDLTIEHNGWGDAHGLSITIYLGSDRVDPDELVLPEVRGKARGTAEKE